MNIYFYLLLGLLSGAIGAVLIMGSYAGALFVMDALGAWHWGRRYPMKTLPAWTPDLAPKSEEATIPMPVQEIRSTMVPLSPIATEAQGRLEHGRNGRRTRGLRPLWQKTGEWPGVTVPRTDAFSIEDIKDYLHDPNN